MDSFRALALRSGAIVLVASVMLVACDPLSRNSNVGVRLAGNGSLIEVIYADCEGDSAAKVELWKTNGPVVGDSDDELLWRIATTGEPSLDMFIVGEVPPGFTEQSPLSSPKLPKTKLAVDIESKRKAGSVVSFYLSELRQSQVFASGRYWSEAEFRDQMRQDCPGA